MFQSVILALILNLIIFPVLAKAEDLKIGYVNVERLQRESNPAHAALLKLQTEFEKREKDLLETQTRIKQNADKLEKETSLPDIERIRKQRELVDQNREFERRRREYQEDLNQRRSEEVSLLIEKANKIIKQISEQEHYDLILQDAVYASSKVDITEKVIKALNENAFSLAPNNTSSLLSPTK